MKLPIKTQNLIAIIILAIAWMSVLTSCSSTPDDFQVLMDAICRQEVGLPQMQAQPVVETTPAQP